MILQLLLLPIATIIAVAAVVVAAVDGSSEGRQWHQSMVGSTQPLPEVLIYLQRL
jgi:hypothetical protein